MLMKNVLIVEDNHDIASLIQMHLADTGYQTVISSDGLSAVEHTNNTKFDLVILDLMLPKMDGLDVCRSIRKQSSYTPILMLTSKSSELDRVLGLEVGADDYVTKPFSIRELLARVKSQFRRAEATTLSDSMVNELVFDDLQVNLDTRRVTLGDRNIDLTAKEFDLLHKFAQNPGRVYTRSQLLDSVWGYGHEGYEHTVNSHINRLRSKIEIKPAHPRYILTVWGVGYKFNDKL
ncbi:MAG: response regulator transcription factor [Gammaproteobacteria bacterium]|nr:response regulator transcription factor [Gammaproteobacteria bacterium]